MLTKFQAGCVAVLVNIVVIAVCFKLLNVINKKAVDEIKKQESNSPLLRFMPIITNICKVLVVFIAITGILQSQGYSVSSILAGFGIGGLAVGMAAKETIANVFGSISILSDRVYKVGDYVKVEGIEGYVEDISIRSTKIRDLDNFLITIPNNIAANAVITNVSKAQKRLLKINFGVTYSTGCSSIEKVRELIKEIAVSHADIHNDFTIAVHDLGDSSINIRFMGYIKTGSYFKFLKVRGEFLQEAIAKFRENNIDFAFPTRTVYLENSENKIEN